MINKASSLISKFLFTNESTEDCSQLSFKNKISRFCEVLVLLRYYIYGLSFSLVYFQ